MIQLWLGNYFVLKICYTDLIYCTWKYCVAAGLVQLVKMTLY